MKFGQLIEYNLGNIFLKNNIRKMVEKLVPDPFVKHQNLAYIYINSLKFYTVSFKCIQS